MLTEDDDLIEAFFQNCLKAKLPLLGQEEYLKGTVNDTVFLIRTVENWHPGRDLRRDALILTKILAPSVILGVRMPEIPHIADVVLSSLSEWTFILRPYFEEPKRTPISPTTLIRHQLNPEDSEQTGIWDNESTWRDTPLIPRIFQHLLMILPERSLSKMDTVTKLVPFVIHLVEDYDPLNRLYGVVAMRQLLRIVSTKNVSQMRLDELFHQSLIKNLSFDSDELKAESLGVLLDVILPLDTLRMERRLSWSEDLLSLLMRETIFTKEIKIVELYLGSLCRLISILGVATVCHIKELLGLVLDCTENEQIRQFPALLGLIDALIDNAWPRLHAHLPLLEQIIAKFPKGLNASQLSLKINALKM
jgi:hypothetical protein